MGPTPRGSRCVVQQAPRGGSDKVMLVFTTGSANTTPSHLTPFCRVGVPLPRKISDRWHSPGKLEPVMQSLPRPGLSPPTWTAPLCVPTERCLPARLRHSRKWRNVGAMLVFVTGRPPRWMGGVAGARYVTVAGHMRQRRAGLRLAQRTDSRISPNRRQQVLEEVVARLRRTSPSSPSRWSTKAVSRTSRTSGWEAGTARPPRGPCRYGATLTSRPCAKLLALHPRMDPDELHASVHDLVGHLVTPTHSSGTGADRDERPRGHQGHRAGRTGRTARDQARRQVVAFGDMPNDLPMLSWAGTSYAVANAHPACWPRSIT